MISPERAKLVLGDIFGVYKPKGPTSHDIINQLRKLTGIQTIGHAGTLDPLASGVLVVGIGREGTKRLKEIVERDKEYVADVRLGMESSTDDEAGEKKEFSVQAAPSQEKVIETLKTFSGIIWQDQPIFSAIRVRGQRAHELARQGQKPNLGKRQVEIKSIELLNYAWPNLNIRVITGAGAYIRVLARDIGKKLGVGGYLADLERTRVGEFTIEKAVVLK